MNKSLHAKRLTTTLSLFRSGRLGLGIVLALLLLGPGYCFALGSDVDDVGSALKGKFKTFKKAIKQPAEDIAAETPKAAKYSGKGAAATSGSTTGSIFAAEPVNPLSPPQGTASFQAGDRIYGMLKAEKPWKELSKNNNYIIVWLTIDGEQKVYKSIGMNRAELLERDYFIIDIAPDPARMTNYTDRDIVFPEKDGYRFGPELFTKYLSELTPGEHSFRLEVKAYNNVFAAGEFTISGDDYSVYASLLDEIQNSSAGMQTMPRPGMTDTELEAEMATLLKNAGWPDLARLIIVDKDWWLDRVAGGDSAIESRHIEAAAAAKDSDGSYYFRNATFHQPMLITGAWGKLTLTHTGEKKPITKENINK